MGYVIGAVHRMQTQIAAREGFVACGPWRPVLDPRG